jgi:Ca2+-transporting ATPase
MEEDLASTSSLDRYSIGCSSIEDLPSMKKFEIPHKGSSPEALEGWRRASFALNASRRFRYVADLKKRGEAEEALKQRRRFRISVRAVEAAWRFHDGK